MTDKGVYYMADSQALRLESDADLGKHYRQSLSLQQAIFGPFAVRVPADSERSFNRP